MMIELTAVYDARQSFYRKAFYQHEEDGTIVLYSYETKVATYTPGDDDITVLGTWSQTTTRHVKEFSKQITNGIIN